MVIIAMLCSLFIFPISPVGLFSINNFFVPNGSENGGWFGAFGCHRKFICGQRATQNSSVNVNPCSDVSKPDTTYDDVIIKQRPIKNGVTMALP